MSEEKKMNEEKNDDKPRAKRMTIAKARKVIQEQNQGAHVTPEMTDKEVIEFAKCLPSMRKVKILLAPKDDGSPGCFVQVNGKPGVLLERGKEIVVPEYIVEALKNAISFEYHTKDNADKTGTIAVPTRKHAEMMSILGYVDEPA